MGWFKEFVSALTGESTSKVSKAGHDFRDHSGAREGRDVDDFKSPPEWADTKTESGIDLFPKDK